MGYMTNGLTFNTLRGGNKARLPHFKNKHGELAHSKPDGSDWSPAQWLQAVVGELGEYANLRKKYERGDLTAEEFEVEAAKELADVQCYLDILAQRALDTPEQAHPDGIDLGKATMAKFNEVSIRVGSPVRIDAEDWHYAAEPEQAGFVYLECPECGDRAVVPVTSTAIFCNICAGDKGEEVRMTRRQARSTDKVPADQDHRPGAQSAEKGAAEQ